MQFFIWSLVKQMAVHTIDLWCTPSHIRNQLHTYSVIVIHKGIQSIRILLLLHLVKVARLTVSGKSPECVVSQPVSQPFGLAVSQLAGQSAN